MDFFAKFVNKEITQEQFIEQLQSVTTKIQKKSTLTQEEILIINQYIDQIEDSILNQQLELFIKFALYIGNRGMYEQLYQIGFEKIQLIKENPDANLLGLYIIKRTFQSENNKVLIIFLNDILRQQKTVERKFVLLEIFIQILPKIEKREIHLANIFPVILIVINEGLQKYLKYKQQQLQNDLNEDNQFTKLYMNNFQKWTLSFFKRIFESIKKFQELKYQNTAIKELYGIDTIYEYFDHQLTRKPESPQLLVKHFVLLFLSDLIQGILECEQSLNDAQLDVDVIKQLLSSANQMVIDIHDNKLEIIENYLSWIKFNEQFNVKIEQQYQNYSNQQPYNPCFVSYLTYQILTQNNFEKLLSIDYKLKILIGSLYEVEKFKNIKCDIQSKLITLIVKYLNERKSDSKIKNANYFITHFDFIILLILEKAGSGLQDETPYISAWKKAETIFTIEAWARIIEESIKFSENYQLLSYMVNSFRVNNSKQDCQVLKKYYDIIIQAIFKKESGNVDAKVLLFDSVSLLIQQLKLKKIDISDYFETKWKQHLKKFEKDIQQSLDYLELKQKEDDETKLKEDQVYQAIKTQESNIRIAYYNLQKILE